MQAGYWVELHREGNGVHRTKRVGVEVQRMCGIKGKKTGRGSRGTQNRWGR